MLLQLFVFMIVCGTWFGGLYYIFVYKVSRLKIMIYSIVFSLNKGINKTRSTVKQNTILNKHLMVMNQTELCAKETKL